MPVKQKNKDIAAPEAKRSYFDGGVLQLIGWRLLAGLITLVSLGIAYPWAMCMVLRWEAKHTVINGRRLKFTGRGLQLWGKYLLWAFLTVITLGIYGIWLGLDIKKWQIEHMVYADDEEMAGRFTGTAGGWFGHHLLWFVLTVLTLGIGYAWGEKGVLRWEAEHTELGGGALTFHGTGGQLFGRYLLWLLLTVLTLGVFGLFVPVRYLKWKISHTFALACVPEYHIKSRAHEENAIRDSMRFAQADNDTQLERVKSGIIGDEMEDELRAFAEIGSRSSMYELALRLKGEEYGGEALEYLRKAAMAGYHPAMLDYALYSGPERGALYAQLLEGSAINGNIHAPWLLAQFYEDRARMLHQVGSYESPEELQKAAYWFKVAMERGDAEALQNKDRYEILLRSLALWFAERRERRNSGSGIWLLVLAVLVVLAGAVSLWRIYFVKPADTGPTEAAAQVQVVSDGRTLQADTPLFNDVPWEPSVVSFENLTLTNPTEQTVIWTMELTGTQDVLLAIAIDGRVSEGDMPRVMKQLESFQPAQTMTVQYTLAQGESRNIALILYWPGNTSTEIPSHMILPVYMEIYAEITEE